MTKIDFYITSIVDSNDYLNFACRLTEKAFRKQHNVYLHTESKEVMQSLDDMMWTFRPNSFLPHGNELSSHIDSDHHSTSNQANNQSDEALVGRAEVMLGFSGNPGKHHDILINLTSGTPKFFSRFSRVAEVVSANEAAKVKSRERYKFYRDRGYPIEVHNL